MENKKPTIERKSSYESLGEEFPNFQDTAEYDDIQNAIIEKLKLIFWDDLQDDIKEEKYDKLLKVLNDIKTRICDLIPNRKDLHKNISDTIDTELIKQMIKHNAIDNNYIFNIIQFIITQLKNLILFEMNHFMKFGENKQIENLCLTNLNYILSYLYFFVKHSIELIKLHLKLLLLKKVHYIKVF